MTALVIVELELKFVAITYNTLHFSKSYKLLNLRESVTNNQTLVPTAQKKISLTFLTYFMDVKQVSIGHLAEYQFIFNKLDNSQIPSIYL